MGEFDVLFLAFSARCETLRPDGRNRHRRAVVSGNGDGDIWSRRDDLRAPMFQRAGRREAIASLFPRH